MLKSYYFELNSMNKAKLQTPEEEQLNAITHAFGFMLALIASFFLLKSSLKEGIHLRFASYFIYCIGLLTLYLASTLYHSAKDPQRKRKLNIFDHSAIYLLIAGTYTPITLLTIKGISGMVILSIVWITAIAGIALKLYFTGRYPKISTTTYVLMGWVIVVAIKPLVKSMVLPGLIWLVAGGLFYTIGALFYQRKSMKYNHVIFHIFVIMGSFCHYLVILNYTG